VNLWNDLGFSLCAVPSVCHVVATSDERKKVQVEVSTVLWDAWDMNNFYFLFLLFSDFIGILFSFCFLFFLDDERGM